MSRSLLAGLFVAAVAAVLYWVNPQFFFKDDFQLQFLPASREVARAWSSGSLPLLNAHSWFSGALAAEYQFGVFSVFRGLLDVVVWAIPASLGARAAMLFIVHAAVLASGAYLLARSYDVRPELATMVAVIAALNGWMLWWGTTWFVAIAAFAWIPWYWLALRRRHWVGIALALYLVLSAGSPYVAVMALAIAASSVMGSDPMTKLRMTAASFLGLCLAAPAVLMLLEFYPSGARMAGQRMEAMWVVPPAGLFGFIVPSFSATWIRFLDRSPHAALELLGSFVPLAGLLAIRSREFFRRLRPELILSAVALLLMMLPSRAPFRWSFHWLPLFHLVIAIAGACALEKVRRAWMWGIALVILTLAAALLFDHDPRTTMIYGAALIALCIVWGVHEIREPFSPPQRGEGARSADEGSPLCSDSRVRPSPGLRPPSPLARGEGLSTAITVLIIVGTFIAFSQRSDVPIFENAEVLLTPAHFDATRRYLAMYDATDVGLDGRGEHIEMRPGNTPALAGLEFVNGYSPIGPEGLATVFRFEFHGTMPPDRAEQILRFESGRNQLLHHLGVDGLVVPEPMAVRHRALLATNGWQPVARVGMCLLLHRTERDPRPLFPAALAIKAADDEHAYRAIGERTTPQLPIVLLTPGASGRERYGRRDIVAAVQTRTQSTFVVRGKGPKALVVFRRPWLPGLRATLNGDALPVLRADMLMPAVEIPADAQGEVRLFYRPRSLVAGSVIAGLALLVLAALSIRIRR